MKEEDAIELLERCQKAFNSIDYSIKIIEAAVKRDDENFPYFAINYLIGFCAERMKWDCLEFVMEAKLKSPSKGANETGDNQCATSS